MFTPVWQVFTSIPYNCFMMCTAYSASINGLMVLPGVNTSPTFLVHNILANFHLDMIVNSVSERQISNPILPSLSTRLAKTTTLCLLTAVLQLISVNSSLWRQEILVFLYPSCKRPNVVHFVCMTTQNDMYYFSVHNGKVIIRTITHV